MSMRGPNKTSTWNSRPGGASHVKDLGALGRLRASVWVVRGLALVRSLGPYAAIELLLPGGTLIVLILWLYRRYQTRSAADLQLPWLTRLGAAARAPTASASP